MSDRKCVNCKHNTRTSKEAGRDCYCEIDGHYIGYVECFEHWCKKWSKDHTFDDDYFNMVCPVCGKKFHLKSCLVKKAKTHYCSKKCQNEARKEYMRGEGNHQYGIRGKQNASWKSGEKKSCYGYKMVRIYDHPFAPKDKMMFEHRLIAEKYLLTDENSVEIDGKRYLSPDYIVHHKNGDRTDNRPENLEIMKLAKHSSMHNFKKRRPRDPITGRFLPGEIEI